MEALLTGYARVSTDQQDLTAQRDGGRCCGTGSGGTVGFVCYRL